MKPLFVLLGVFCITLAATKIFDGRWNFIFSGNLAISIMLLFTAIGHFKFSKGMTMMMPEFIPFKKELILLTGAIEIAAAIGLLLPSMRYFTSILLIVFFISILPVNINAAIKKVDYENGTYDGNGINYLWFRLPLQVLFILWVWYFGIYKG
jgi:uncharacterized membrane protein